MSSYPRSFNSHSSRACFAPVATSPSHPGTTVQTNAPIWQLLATRFHPRHHELFSFFFHVHTSGDPLAGDLFVHHLVFEDALAIQYKVVPQRLEGILVECPAEAIGFAHRQYHLRASAPAHPSQTLRAKLRGMEYSMVHGLSATGKHNIHGAQPIRGRPVMEYSSTHNIPLCVANQVACARGITTLYNITSFYGSSCANNGKGALNTPKTLPQRDMLEYQHVVIGLSLHVSRRYSIEYYYRVGRVCSDWLVAVVSAAMGHAGGMLPGDRLPTVSVNKRRAGSEKRNAAPLESAGSFLVSLSLLV
eukprot:1173630-Prorocentrum_minimum.AAC.1